MRCDPGLAGVTLRLYANATCTGSAAAGATSDATGHYQFNTLVAGIYCLAVDAANFNPGAALNHFKASPQHQGPDAALDSDGDTTYKTGSLSLAAGAQTTSIDFGFWQPAIIAVRKQTTLASSYQFVYDAAGSLNPNGFILANGEVYTYTEVVPGQAYRVAEAPTMPHWQLVGLQCDGWAGNSVPNLAAGTVDVVPAPGATVTCTFVSEPVVPQAVMLEDFGAVCSGRAVDVSWVTSSEISNLGFNLRRGTSADGPSEQLNPTLIPSQAPGSSQGAAYAWQDVTVEPGTTYYYWLEDSASNGIVTRYGPVSAVCQMPTAVTVQGLAATSATGGSGASVLAGLGRWGVRTLER